MNQRKAIFISIEGLGTNLVGAYGNSIAPTPCFDRLASQGIVFDQVWSDSTDADEVLRSWLSGTHAIEHRSKGLTERLDGGSDVNLFGLGEHTVPKSAVDVSKDRPFSHWRAAVENTLLVTDAPAIADGFSSEFVGRVLLVEPPQNVGDVIEFERLLQVALGAWEENHEDYSMLWIHSVGLSGVWDAPYEFRQILCDDEDPDPPKSTEPMELFVDEKTDPDEVFGISCAVGGQMIAYDQVLGEIIQAIDELVDRDKYLLGIIGTNGFPLGEHGYVGGRSKALQAETLHVPFVLRPGQLLPLGARHSIILQPHSLGEYLSDWFDSSVSDDELSEWLETLLSPFYDGEDPIGAAVATSAQSCYVCTPAWSARTLMDSIDLTIHDAKPLADDDDPIPATAVYVKPDDRWEQNDVSTRVPAIVGKLHVLRQKLTAHFLTPVDRRGPINWLDDELVQLHR